MVVVVGRVGGGGGVGCVVDFVVVFLESSWAETNLVSDVAFFNVFEEFSNIPWISLVCAWREFQQSNIPPVKK